MSELGSDIQFLPGVGPKRAALLKSELDLHTLDDLIHFYPFRYIDRSRITPIVSVTPDLAYVQVQGTVVSRNLINIKHLSIIVDDGTARMEMVFFKGVKWNFERLAPGTTFRGGSPAGRSDRRRDAYRRLSQHREAQGRGYYRKDHVQAPAGRTLALHA